MAGFPLVSCCRLPDRQGLEIGRVRTGVCSASHPVVARAFRARCGPPAQAHIPCSRRSAEAVRRWKHQPGSLGSRNVDAEVGASWTESSLAEASLSSLLASVRATSSSPRGLRADEGPGPGPGSALLQEELARRRRAMMLFRRQCPAPRGGTLTIAPLTAIHAAFAAELLSETFLVALGAPGIYRGYLSRQVRSYVANHVSLAPKCILMAAVLHAGTDTAQEDGPPGSLVAIAEVSFTAETRSSYVTLDPPPASAYLCNMAVVPDMRRRGIARELLRAAEDVATSMHEPAMYLHLRLKDKHAQGLYESAGYTVDRSDSILAPLVGIDRRHLMIKKLMP